MPPTSGYASGYRSVLKLYLRGCKAMNNAIQSTIKEWAIILVVAFTIGIAVHFGMNTAKLIWPVPPVDFEVTVSE